MKGNNCGQANLTLFTSSAHCHRVLKNKLPDKGPPHFYLFSALAVVVMKSLVSSCCSQTEKKGNNEKGRGTQCHRYLGSLLFKIRANWDADRCVPVLSF